MSEIADYSRLDRTLHRLAFAAVPAQIALSDIEDRLYDVPEVTLRQPVFVTSLARAGTTLLLNLLSASPELACHSYRNMPFVLCPLLWSRLSRPFHDKGVARERRHGDGMTIDYDSPEAFEEVIWKAHWPEKYTPERILPWSAGDRDADFEAFLRQHLRKIVLLAGGGGNLEGEQRRYLSKNNANIARLALLQEIFPDARIVVPLRNPWDHARSLLRQHRRFIEIHAEDGFSQLYMEWLGHFEFGAALRPIDFGGWVARNRERSPEEIAFWLVYWCNCYEAVLAAAGPNVAFIDYDSLCAAPEQGLSRLAAAAGLDSPADLGAQAASLRRPTDYGVIEELGEPLLTQRIMRLYQRLRDAAARPIHDSPAEERRREA
ncbi:MAG: sulfotransferase [Rhodovibrionaceae bacterium]